MPPVEVGADFESESHVRWHLAAGLGSLVGSLHGIVSSFRFLSPRLVFQSASPNRIDLISVKLLLQRAG